MFVEAGSAVGTIVVTRASRASGAGSKFFDVLQGNSDPPPGYDVLSPTFPFLRGFMSMRAGKVLDAVEVLGMIVEGCRGDGKEHVRLPASIRYKPDNGPGTCCGAITESEDVLIAGD